MNDLRDRLLLEDGIDPTEVSEWELARFRTLLAEEQKRLKGDWRREAPVPRLRLRIPQVLALRIPLALRIASLTCLLTVLAVLAVVYILQGRTVYARALSSLQKARSIHAVGYGFQDGRPVKQSEIWHERGVGTRIQWRQGERTIEMYDDGRDRYEYVQTSQYAVKKPGQGQLLPRELTEPLRYLQDARRDASRDQTIDGISCLGYERQDPNTLSLMWIDEVMQFRRYEEYKRTQDQWRQVERVEIDYDEPVELPMPPETFQRRGIRIVEPAQVLETRYGAKNALASTEVLGLLFSIHELHRCGDYLLVASSLRPTEQTLDELGKAGLQMPLPDHGSLGGFDLCSWWQRRPDGSIEERPYAIRELGRLSCKGVDIGWHALLARGQWPGQQDRLEVCAYVRTDDPLRQLRQQRGLDWRGQFRPLVTVAIPAGQSDSAALAADLYELGHAVTAVGRSAQDLFVSESSGVTLEQFRGRLENLLAGLRPMGERWDRVGSDLDVRLVDERGTPVAGAWLGPRLQYAGGSIHPQTPGPDGASPVSDEAGQIVIPGERLFNRKAPQDSRSIAYAVHPGRRLVACRAVGGDDFGSPVQVIMRPACLVRMVLAHPEPQDGDDAAIGVDLSTSIPRPYSLNRVILDVVRCSTREPSIEIPLPPGEYELRAYADDGADRSGYRRFTVPPDARTLDLGTVELRAGP